VTDGTELEFELDDDDDDDDEGEVVGNNNDDDDESLFIVCVMGTDIRDIGMSVMGMLDDDDEDEEEEDDEDDADDDDKDEEEDDMMTGVRFTLKLLLLVEAKQADEGMDDNDSNAEDGVE